MINRAEKVRFKLLTTGGVATRHGVQISDVACSVRRAELGREFSTMHALVLDEQSTAAGSGHGPPGQEEGGDEVVLPRLVSALGPKAL